MPLDVLFFFPQDYSGEIAAYHRGEVPSHRLWGLAELRKLGARARIVPAPRFYPKFLRAKMRGGLGWAVHQALFALFNGNRLDCIVAINESCTLPALLLKKLGLLRVPLVIVNMALLHPKFTSGLRLHLWRALLPMADAIVSVASAQLPLVAQDFGLEIERQKFIPMTVDTSFFPVAAGPEVGGGDFILSVGTNEGKDFVTLVDALPPGQKLVIVTDAANAALIEAHTGNPDIEVRQAVPITQLRALYRQTRLHVTPLHAARFGSGHTVLLENMSLGRALIVSDTDSMRDYVENGETGITVEPGNVAQLRARIEEVARDPQAFASLGRQAAARARENFDAKLWGRKLLAVIEAAIADPVRPGKK